MTAKEKRSAVMTISNALVKQGMSRSAAMVRAWITVKLRTISTKAAGVTFGKRQALIERLSRYSSEDITMLNDGWFYSTAPDLQESSTLSEKQQKRAVDNLVKAGLLKCELRGMPAKRSFFIIENAELIGYYIAKGKEIADKIKPKAAETYERKRLTGEEKPNDTSVLPCSDKTAEQETTKGQTLLRQKVGASSDETAEHTFNHNINNHHIERTRLYSRK